MSASGIPAPSPLLAARARRFAGWSALAALTIGLVVLAGWFAQISVLKSIVPSFVTMKFNTAFCIALLAIALLVRRGSASHPAARLAFVSAAVVAALTLATLSEYATGRDLAVDDLFMRDNEPSTAPAPSGRMAPNTALGLLLAALAILTDRRRTVGLALALVTGTAVIAGIGFIGYLYDVRSLYAAGKATAMAMHTTTSLLLLAAAFLAGHPERGYIAVLLSPGPGGRMARRLIPTATGAMVILGWLRLLGQSLGLFETAFGVAILVIASCITLSAIVLIASRSTDRSEASRLAAESAGIHYQTIATTMSEGAMLLEASGAIVACNPSAERILGVRAEDIVGVTHRDPVWKSIHEDGSPFSPDEYPVAISLRDGVRVANMLVGIQRPDETVAWIRVSSTPLFRPGQPAPYAVTVTFADVTEVRTVHQQLVQAQKLDALGRLAGGVAHDFNNMLMVIFSRADLLQTKLSDEGLIRYVADIGAAAKQCAKMTQQLLAAARKQVLAPEVTDVIDVVKRTLELLGRTLGEHVTIRTDFPPEPWRIYADAGQLGQVVLNLAVNARDAMPEGGTLTVEVRHFSADAGYIALHPAIPHGEYVVLVVSDTGTGIPPAIRERIFDPFFTTKEEGKGSGLGLSVVYGIVEQTGGHVNVYSEEGHGTTFKLFFPRYHGDVDRQPQPSVERPSRGHETILVVEDEFLVREVILETLQDSGYAVLAAGDGSKALELARSHGGTIDLLLTDVVMPGAKGPVLAAQLKLERPALRVVFMSGYSDGVVDQGTATKLQARFLEKPVLSTTLLTCIREALDA